MRLLMPFISMVSFEQAEHAKMSKIINRYRPEGDLSVSIPVKQHADCGWLVIQFLVVCLPWSRLAMLISSLVRIGSQLAQEAGSLPSGSLSSREVSFMDR